MTSRTVSSTSCSGPSVREERRLAAGLVIGTAQLGTTYGVANRAGAMDDETAVQLVRKAAEKGVLAFDTAPGYGSAERLIGKADVRTPVFTKLAPRVNPEVSVDGSLERLGRRRLDVLQVHDEAQLHDRELLGSLRALVGTRVAALGASIYDELAFRLAVDDGSFGYVQVPASVADRRFTGAALEVARSAGRKVLARSVYLQGALLMEQLDLPAHLAALSPVLDAVDRIATSTGRSRHELLLAFVRDLPGVHGVLVGCETLEQLEAILLAFQTPPLDPATRSALEALPSLPAKVTDPRRWPAPDRRPPRRAAGK